MPTFAATAPEAPRLLMLPFALLLVAVAIAPLILRHHWERHYYKVSFTLAAFVLAYYAFVRGDLPRATHALVEYLSFMVVVGSFFVVAGGIHLRARSQCRPLTNVVFLIVGALLANVIGTIGASMLLIRPWIEMNRTRFAGFHLAFFIFIVSNIGGLLLPVGPPLFLGYQKGVPFFWPLFRLWPHWLFVSALLLVIFYLLDRRSFKRLTDSGVASFSAASPEKWHVFGKRNLALMSALLIALIALPSPVREFAMITIAATSYFVSPRRVHEANGFTFLPLQEVAALFFGIFSTMIPVLDYVEMHARDLGLRTDPQFFWATGLFSALLDNAPAYLTFLAGALGLHKLHMNNANGMAEFIARYANSLIAVSLGATFFGALTYIGNGPNLLVKAIAQAAKVPTPSFFGFIFKYAAPVLLPIFALLSILFLRK
jgi:Na+/H+ antiporter NhaD/arsenite permease-like protein